MGDPDESPTPDTGAKSPGMLALEGCDLLRRLLESSFGGGPARYRYKEDVLYRELRQYFFENLRAEPSLAKLARSANRLLPTSLAESVRLSSRWWASPSNGGRLQVIELQNRIMVALEKAGLLVTVRHGTTPAPVVPLNAAPPALTDRPNRAQLRAEERRQRAQELRAAGRTIKEIAAELGCSERTVGNYLDGPK